MTTRDERETLYIPIVGTAFKNRVAQVGDCWIWQGSTFQSGYGRLQWQGRTVRAHRLAYFGAHGVWPSLVRHTCDVRLCVNPDHLLAGSHVDNMADMVQRGRSYKGKGEQKSTSRFTAEQIHMIRALAKRWPYSRVAALFETYSGTIAKIALKQRWSHI